ncbi:MAG: glycosyltransferase family 2 protein [Anaerolineales bacterium]|nr:glycosyltransferase family 2 protein [Anaerolineales bacterium]
MNNTKIEINIPPVSVIIPAYNEEKWIGTTLSSILESGFPCEVIVVDDGSSDKTSQILKTFGESINVISQPVNKGKGAALVSGINEASGEIVIFCDAHLLGLNKYHLMTLTLPLVYDLARVTLGQGISAEFSLTSVFSPFLILTGQRAYFKEDLLPLRKDMENLGYGVETFLFNRFPRDKTVAVMLPGLTHLLKKDTSSVTDATLEYLREIMEVLETIARIGLLERIELTQLKKSIASILARFKSPGD